MRRKEVERYKKRLEKELSYWQEAAKIYPKAKAPKTQVLGCQQELDKINKVLADENLK